MKMLCPLRGKKSNPHPPRSSVGSRFSKRTLVRTLGNRRDAPRPCEKKIAASHWAIYCRCTGLPHLCHSSCEAAEQSWAAGGGGGGAKGRGQRKRGPAKHAPDPEPEARDPGAEPRTASCRRFAVKHPR